MPSRRGDVASELEKLKYDAMISKAELTQFSDYLKERHAQVDAAIEAETLGYYLGQKSKATTKSARAKALGRGGRAPSKETTKSGIETVEREL